MTRELIITRSGCFSIEFEEDLFKIRAAKSNLIALSPCRSKSYTSVILCNREICHFGCLDHNHDDLLCRFYSWDTSEKYNDENQTQAMGFAWPGALSLFTPDKHATSENK